MKFDKLGVNQALLEFRSPTKEALVAPEQFLPLLDRVSKNESYMHMSRERAAQVWRRVSAILRQLRKERQRNDQASCCGCGRGR